MIFKIFYRYIYLYIKFVKKYIINSKTIGINLFHVFEIFNNYLNITILCTIKFFFILVNIFYYVK